MSRRLLRAPAFQTNIPSFVDPARAEEYRAKAGQARQAAIDKRTFQLGRRVSASGQPTYGTAPPLSQFTEADAARRLAMETGMSQEGAMRRYDPAAADAITQSRFTAPLMEENLQQQMGVTDLGRQQVEQETLRTGAMPQQISDEERERRLRDLGTAQGIGERRREGERVTRQFETEQGVREQLAPMQVQQGQQEVQQGQRQVEAPLPIDEREALRIQQLQSDREGILTGQYDAPPGALEQIDEELRQLTAPPMTQPTGAPAPYTLSPTGAPAIERGMQAASAIMASTGLSRFLDTQLRPFADSVTERTPSKRTLGLLQGLKSSLDSAKLNASPEMMEIIKAQLLSDPDIAELLSQRNLSNWRIFFRGRMTRGMKLLNDIHETLSL